MNSTQIQLVQYTFNRYVAPLGDGAAVVFYERLFALDPALRALFPPDMTAQRRKLVQTLAFVVNGLDRVDRIVDDVRSLGQRHRGYGVRPEHYAIVGAALLQTLQTAIGAEYSIEVEQAWTAAYTLLAETMQSQREQPQPVV